VLNLPISEFGGNIMVNPISNSTIYQAELSQAASKKAAQNVAAKSQPVRIQDTVTLKSAGDADHDGDSK
jgi:hypothetical protein